MKCQSFQHNLFWDPCEDQKMDPKNTKPQRFADPNLWTQEFLLIEKRRFLLEKKAFSGRAWHRGGNGKRDLFQTASTGGTNVAMSCDVNWPPRGQFMNEVLQKCKRRLHGSYHHLHVSLCFKFIDAKYDGNTDL